MKNLFILAFTGAMFMVGCSKIDDDAYTIKNYPNDVAAEIKDYNFKTFCITRYDLNGDQKISKSEALQVDEMDIRNLEISDIYGIQYFSNLKSLYCYSCEKLTSVDLRWNKKLIDIRMPYCFELQDVQLNDNLPEIKDGAFEECRKLQKIIIPNSVTYIGEQAFHNCYSLISILIPKNVSSLGLRVFNGCQKLETISCERITPPTMYGQIAGFGTCKALSKIYVPKESVDAYKSVSGWSFYDSIIEGYDF